jgi:hypothetical protein
MAYILPFVKVNILGHFGTSTTNVVENWQTGFHIIKNGGMAATPTELTAFLTALLVPISTFHTSANTVVGTKVYLDGASAALIGTDGHYANGSLQPTTRVVLGTPVPGIGTTTNPFTTATVLSLRSLILRGPASHGRMYYPNTSTVIDPLTGVMLTSAQQGWANQTQTLINAINAQAVTSFGANTYMGLVSPLGSGFQSPVTQAWIGARMDHMESREGELSEAYAVRSLSVTARLTEDRDREIRRLLDEQREASAADDDED